MKTVGDRIQLSDSERALARRRPDKTVYVAVIPFRGPRGRKYRPLRTEACLTPDLAVKAANALRAKPYAHGAFPLSTKLYACSTIGVITEDLSDAV